MRLANDKLRLITTGKCNISCFYCHNEGQAKTDSFLSLDLLENVLGAVRLSISSVREVTVSGGEPLVHPEVVEIVRRAAGVCGNVTMVSNGLLADETLIDQLSRAGLRKLRLGVDSLNPFKSRPSPGYFDREFDVRRVIRWASDAGVEVDMNVVVTRFNQRELGDLAGLAIDEGLSIKFFENVDVFNYGDSSMSGNMKAKPHVSAEKVIESISAAIGAKSGDFRPTDQFGESNLSLQVGASEIRYCRYLCPFGLCWLTGTRVDAEGYAFACMSNRGLDRIIDSSDSDSTARLLATAALRECRSGHQARENLVIP